MKLIFAVLSVSLKMGLTRCYKTEGFLHLFHVTSIKIINDDKNNKRVYYYFFVNYIYESNYTNPEPPPATDMLCLYHQIYCNLAVRHAYWCGKSLLTWRLGGAELTATARSTSMTASCSFIL